MSNIYNKTSQIYDMCRACSLPHYQTQRPVSSRPKPTHQEWYCVKGSEGDSAQPVFWQLWWLGW